MPQKILLVEDLPHERGLVENRINGRAVVISATSCAEVPQLLQAYPDIGVIIMDGYLDDGPSFDLVVDLRENGCEIPIVTSSERLHTNETLMRAGCSHQSDKNSSWHVALTLLNIKP